jgi:hypothetical protein
MLWLQVAKFKINQTSTCLVNTGPNGFHDRVTLLQMVHGTTLLHVFLGLVNCPILGKEDIYNILQTPIEETTIQAGMLSQSEWLLGFS